MRDVDSLNSEESNLCAVFSHRRAIDTSVPSPPPPHRWLAYGEKRLTGYLQSRGGMSAEASHSYTASVLHAAKSISKGGRQRLPSGGGRGAFGGLVRR